MNKRQHDRNDKKDKKWFHPSLVLLRFLISFRLIDMVVNVIDRFYVTDIGWMVMVTFLKIHVFAVAILLPQKLPLMKFLDLSGFFPDIAGIFCGVPIISVFGGISSFFMDQSSEISILVMIDDAEVH